ncbi:MAG: type II toxin-antitoxin system RelE/ParE family toxin [Terriglobia bacterium]
MTWRIEFTHTAEKQIVRLDRQAQAGILSYLRQRVQPSENPRQFGKALYGDKPGLWRYRLGKHRIICDIQDETLTVLVLALAHRKEAYR